jgi:triosephosphate isomerase (TIM)
MTRTPPSRTSSRRSPSSRSTIPSARSSSTGTSTPSAPGPAGTAPPSPTSPAPLGAPLLVVNLKAYPSALGPAATRIGRLLEGQAARAGVAAAICPSAADLGRLAGELGLSVLAQHADPEPAGAHTGRVVAESIRAAGVRGSLVNHSERPLPPETALQVVGRLDGLGLVPVVCARDVTEARLLASARPAYLAVEPPELIGGEVSVSAARPGLVADTVAAVHAISPETVVLCGAGVHTGSDVRAALALGTEGVLVASAVARAGDPASAIDELLRGFPSARRPPRSYR